MPQITKKTPMMQQYLAIKDQYQDAFLFYRLGDFYELFYDDAKKAAHLLELTLTSRNKNATDPIPMCGVPYHSAQGYIDTLIDLGYKVAICEQVEDAKLVKGNQTVKREVTQVITPGTNVDLGTDEAKNNNYLVALYPQNTKYNLAYVDLSTGELKVTTVDRDLVVNECASLQTKEIVCLGEIDEHLKNQLQNRLAVVFSDQDIEKIENNDDLIESLDNPFEKQTVLGLYTYLLSTQKRYLEHLQQAIHYEVDNFLKMDYDSKYNLELVTSIRSNKKQGTLLWLLDETKTAMGGRLLKQWIEKPLISEQQIINRQNQVQSLLASFFERQQLQENLKGVYDLERLVGKVSFGTANAKDLIQLKNSLKQVPSVLLCIENINDGEWNEVLHNLDPLTNLVDLIEQAILDDVSLSLKDGNLIKPGYNSELDRYLDATTNGKQWLANLEAKERKATGINKLKIGYHRVYGYYIEVSKLASDKIPEGRNERKQTLTNSERFTTPELQEMERTILEAEERSKELEYQLFVEIRNQVKQKTKQLQRLAKGIATLDVLQSFAEISERYQYVRPTFNHKRLLNLKNGRHPVVEKVIGEQKYVPNDLQMDDKCELLLITGPNMSGKSTYMRQLALIVIMAQMGCYVPCEDAQLPIFDQIFTRIGASDNLISGQSTFMVEMMEANNALRHATSDSLILFDELGRGTSTYDGMALAQSIIEFIHNHIKAKTLFSTHYHELTVLDQMLDQLQNIHVEAVEQDGEIIFIHKIQQGPADKSYGVHVAKIAGLPQELLERANQLLASFEQQSVTILPSADKKVAKNEDLLDIEVDSNKDDNGQLTLFESDYSEVDSEIQKLDLMQMTPMEAFNKLYELQQKLRK